ncbi:heme NO-binding domain-containing protein [Cognatishimia sp. MH4019]|uniref:heme NO-binding domain-containing protein n=1 Tax=Cognatishimia sp. MH4019 TaxID=2854030 RepID=UPI001CD49FFD|nr:heme NO-binding domain-containing protein [Cognatishimia sp. MH4019]
MHGLVNRAIQCFVLDTYGDAAWEDVTRRADLGFNAFEAMLHYDDALTEAVMDAAVGLLGKPRDELLEDLGTYLVSHPTQGAVRRLLRFSGADFIDFIHSLDDLPDRARLAVPDLGLPHLVLRDHTPSRFSLECHGAMPGFGYVLLGVLRAMADDYGALVLLDHQRTQGAVESLSIDVVEEAFAKGRSFELVTAPTGAP